MELVVLIIMALVCLSFVLKLSFHNIAGIITIVKKTGKENMEIITKEGEKINRYTPSEDNSNSSNRGKRVGIAYELENGDIIYVPE